VEAPSRSSTTGARPSGVSTLRPIMSSRRGGSAPGGLVSALVSRPGVAARGVVTPVGLSSPSFLLEGSVPSSGGDRIFSLHHDGVGEGGTQSSVVPLLPCFSASVAPPGGVGSIINPIDIDIDSQVETDTGVLPPSPSPPILYIDDPIEIDVDPDEPPLKVRPDPIPQVPAAPTAAQVIAAQRRAAAEHTVFKLPILQWTAHHRHISLGHSFVSQMDQLVHKMLGVRVEVDYCAMNLYSSHCHRFDIKPWQSVSSAFGLYLCDIYNLPSVISVAASFKTSGLFIVPVVPKANPRILLQSGRKAASKVRVAEPWFDFLSRHSVLSFDLPRGTVKGTGFKGAFRGVVASFGKAVRLKPQSVRRQESRFALVDQPCPGRWLPVVPDMWHRVSPLATEGSPSDDVSLGESPSVSQVPLSQMPTPTTSKWPVDLMREETTEFPDDKVRSYALLAMAGSLDVFRGDISKCVSRRSHSFTEEEAQQAHELLLKMASKGFMWGPSPLNPFGVFRLLSIGLVRKHKYVTLSREMRLTSNFSAGDLASVNALCDDPKLIYSHLSVALLCDKAVSMGPGVTCEEGDVEAAFKTVPNAPRLLRLMLMATESRKYGKMFWVDRSNPFGFKPSQWGWECILALIKWILARKKVHDILWFVDGYWHFHHRSDDCAERSRQRSEVLISTLNLPLHKFNPVKTRYGGLGWEWDLDYQCPPGVEPYDPPLHMVKICPMDKFLYFEPLFRQWSVAVEISMKDLDRAPGCIQFLSGGLPTLGPFVAPLIALGVVAARRQVSSRMSPIRLSPEASEAFSVISQLFKTWDRLCPMVQGFGPSAGPEFEGWVDASPENGVGGALFNPNTGVVFMFFHEFSLSEMKLAECLVLSPAAGGPPKTVQSSGVAESMGIQIFLAEFASMCARSRVSLGTDASAALFAFRKAFSPKGSMLIALREARSIVARHHILLNLFPVPRECNFIADYISKRLFVRAECEARRLFGPECKIVWRRRR
jgi:hypothetical protein